MTREEVEQFLAERGVEPAPEGDGAIALRFEDAIELLTRVIATGGPYPAYVDVYARDVTGTLVFREDVTMRDIENMDITFE